MRKLGSQPSENLDLKDFPGWREYWAGEGIFTVADRFGDDGSKGDELEGLLRRANATQLDKIHTEIGTRSKPQVGALFAAEVPTPAEVKSLYVAIYDRLESLIDAST